MEGPPPQTLPSADQAGTAAAQATPLRVNAHGWPGARRCSLHVSVLSNKNVPERRPTTPSGVCSTGTSFLPLKPPTSDQQCRGVPLAAQVSRCPAAGRGMGAYSDDGPFAFEINVKHSSLCSAVVRAEGTALALAFPSAPSSTPSNSKTVSEETDTPPDGCLCFWLSTFRSLQRWDESCWAHPPPLGGSGSRASGWH